MRVYYLVVFLNTLQHIHKTSVACDSKFLFLTQPSRLSLDDLSGLLSASVWGTECLCFSL